MVVIIDRFIIKLGEESSSDSSDDFNEEEEDDSLSGIEELPDVIQESLFTGK